MVKKAKLTLSQKIKRSVKDNGIMYAVLGVMILLIAFTIVSSIQNQNKAQSLENRVYGDDVVEMTYFHLSTCPHCHKQNQFHKVLLEKYPQLKIVEYEISRQESQDKFVEMAEDYVEIDPNKPTTPTTIIGDRVNIGYGSDETTGVTLEEMIQEEIQKIEANWDEETMVRSAELQAQQ